MNLRNLSGVVVLSVSLSVAACGGGGHGEGNCEGSCERSSGGEGDCGGDCQGNCEHHGEGHGHGHGRGGGEAAEALPPTLDAFHTTLGPVWHLEPGAGRATQACTAAATLRENAGGVQSGAAPEGTDAAAWTAGSAALVAATDALVATCGAQGTDVEAKLTAVHEAFHALVAQARPEHGERCEHGEHGEHHGEHHGED